MEEEEKRTRSGRIPESGRLIRQKSQGVVENFRGFSESAKIAAAGSGSFPAANSVDLGGRFCGPRPGRRRCPSRAGTPTRARRRAGSGPKVAPFWALPDWAKILTGGREFSRISGSPQRRQVLGPLPRRIPSIRAVVSAAPSRAPSGGHFQRSNGRDSGRVRVPKWPRVGFFRIGQKS